MVDGAFMLLENAAREVPDRIAIVQPFERDLTFQEWLDRSLSFAARLNESGITQGMRVGLVFDREDWIDLCVAYFAVQRLGAVPVTMSAETPVSVRQFIADDAGISSWLVSRSDVATAVGYTTDRPVHVVASPSRGTASLPAPSIRPTDPADILYTSGTTGTPKAVVTPHGLLNHVYRLSPSAKGGVGPPILHCFPIGTGAALMMIYAPFEGIRALGQAHPVTRPVATVTRFSIEELCRTVERYEVNLVFLVPAMLARLTRLSNKQRDDLRSLDVIHCGSASINPANAVKVAKLLPLAQIVNAYGSTETWPAMVQMRHSPQATEAVGRPANGTRVRIRSLETGEIVKAGQSGRIEVACSETPYRRSYLRDQNPSTTYLLDGWVATGDIGYLDEGGILYLSGRISDILNVGGEKFSSVPIENALAAHPLIEAAAVVGLPHRRLGEYVAAFVVFRGAGVGLTQMREHLRAQLGESSIPRRVFSVPELPTTQNGKVLKRQLKEAVAHGDNSVVEIF